MLTGRVAIVTGGAVRLGAALSNALLEEGAAVCVHYRSHAEEAETLRAAAQSRGRKCALVQADLADPDAASRIVAACTAALGPPSVLINSASLFEPGSLATTNVEDWDRHWQVNLRAPALLARAFAAAQAGQKSGQIINVLDANVARRRPGHLAYSVSKAALAALTELLALELAPTIRVNGVAPGAVLASETTREEQERRIRDRIPLRRSGSAQAVVDAVLYLLKSDFVTGEVIHVAGGEQL